MRPRRIGTNKPSVGPSTTPTLSLNRAGVARRSLCTLCTHGPDGTDADTSVPPTPTRILAVIAVFFFLYVGVEVGFSGWITTYAEGIRLPGANSPTWLNTVFWVSFTLGRLLAVMLAKHVRSGAMLAGSCMLTVGLLLVMAVANGSPAFVWIMTPLIGIAVAPQFATMIAYAEERITLSGRATSWFVSASGIGGLALPFLIGQLLDGSSGAMPVAVCVAAAAATAWLLVVRTVLNRVDSSGAAPGTAALQSLPA